ncbi:glycosyltransferase family A protein [Yoonia sp. I 8.24]|uniref:glycosyltransferase family A protein n=1 Tax=Yoonia sp. I 8.24 TaxID=1537229 RepID=UPI001EDF16BE|nr:glycosyltransferase family A protein [Yoonia sp. I 8.24]MCG3268026.1 glycosyltransferase family 2 protein [Yoonia sp. I 8.24]
MPTIVSLTAIPPRFRHLGPVLECLTAQTAKIDEIRLYVPKRFRRFPEYAGEMPDVPKGVRVIQTDDDLGPASKVLFAVDDLRGSDCNIVYCDDDMLYEPTRFARMIEAGLQHPDACISPAGIDVGGRASGNLPRALPAQKNLSYRARRVLQIGMEVIARKSRPKPPFPHVAKSGYVDIARGWGSVLVKPHFFSREVFEIPEVLWSVDDYWLSGDMARNNVLIWAPAAIPKPRYAKGRDVESLIDATIDGHDRDAANALCIKYMQDKYGVWANPVA